MNSDERMIYCIECKKVKLFTYSTIGTSNGPLNAYVCEEELKNGHQGTK